MDRRRDTDVDSLGVLSRVSNQRHGMGAQPMKKLPEIAKQLRLIAQQLDHGVTDAELDAIISELDKIAIVIPTY
jgi:hypothetical protein